MTNSLNTTLALLLTVIAIGPSPVIASENPISIQPLPSSTAGDFTRAGYAHICFEVTDANAAMAELAEKGIELYAGPFTNTTLNRTFFHIKDPAGTWIEFVEIHAPLNQ